MAFSRRFVKKSVQKCNRRSRMHTLFIHFSEWISYARTFATRPLYKHWVWIWTTWVCISKYTIICNRIFGFGPCHIHDNYFTLYLIQGLSDVEESESIKIKLDEKVINDGPMNLEPDFVRRIALNIRKGAKFSIEQEGSQIWTYILGFGTEISLFIIIT